MKPHDWQPRRSIYYIETELRRMRRNRIRLLKQRLPPMPAGQYADQAVALMSEAIDQDPVPVPTDWAALALDSEPLVKPACTSPRSNYGDGRGCDDDACPRHGFREEWADERQEVER